MLGQRGLLRSESGPVDLLSAKLDPGRRGPFGTTDQSVKFEEPALWLSVDHGVAAPGRLEGKPEAGAEDPACEGSASGGKSV